VSLILLNGLKDIYNVALVVVVLVAFESGLFTYPGDDNKVNLDSFLHVYLNIVLFGVDVVDDSGDLNLVGLEAVFDYGYFTDLLVREAIFY
jgi:hypothetical protein